jgi:hypothetical protein
MSIVSSERRSTAVETEQNGGNVAKGPVFLAQVMAILCLAGSVFACVVGKLLKYKRHNPESRLPGGV